MEVGTKKCEGEFVIILISNEVVEVDPQGRMEEGHIAGDV